MRDFGHIALIFSLMMLAISSGCAGSKWKEYGYGPGDYLNDNTFLSVETMNNYERLANPDVEINYVESLAGHCDNAVWVNGCAVIDGNVCRVWVGERASPNTIAHEVRHCHGWTHRVPRYDMFGAGPEFRANEIRLAKGWFPSEPGKERNTVWRGR